MPELKNAKILFINEAKNVSTTDREFVVGFLGLDLSEDLNGRWTENYVGLQFSGRQIAAVKDFAPGDTVDVMYYLSGMLKSKDDIQPTLQNPRREVIYTNAVLARMVLVSRPAVQSSADSNQTNGAADNQGQQPGTDDLPF